jgi:DNA mismatch repair protein MutS
MAAIVTGHAFPVFGLAIVDLSTGEFAATEGEGESLLAQELQRIRPSEVVLPARLALDQDLTGWLQAAAGEGQGPVRLSPVPDAEATPEAASSRLMAHFRVASLEACGAEGHPLATAAAGVALFYLQDNQISDLAHLAG